MSVLQRAAMRVAMVAGEASGDLLASSGWDGTVRLWDPIVGRELLKIQSEHVLQFSFDDFPK